MFLLIPLPVPDVPWECLASRKQEKVQEHQLFSGKLCKISILMAPKQTFVFVSINKTKLFPLSTMFYWKGGGGNVSN